MVSPPAALAMPAHGAELRSPSRLAERLDMARRGRFVGRAAELALFDAALRDPNSPFFVLHVHAAGGVGKTVLLKQWTTACARAGVPHLLIDGGAIEPTPAAFLAGLRLPCGAFPGNPTQPERQVLLIDSYELLAPLDDWLRDSFLPQLPAGVLVVLSGRQGLSQAWRGDPGWQSVTRLLRLANFDRAESRAYLVTRGLPAEYHEAVLRFAHDHPLALALIADAYARQPDHDFLASALPDVVRALVESLVREVPSATHWLALQVCALARLTTEALLAEVLDHPDAYDLFDWLRGLAIVESGQFGLDPIGIAREVLTADLRWRNPDRHDDLHRRLRASYARQRATTDEAERQRTLLDMLFLRRGAHPDTESCSIRGRAATLPPAIQQGEAQTARLAMPSVGVGVNVAPAPDCDEFGAAVRDALRDYARPGALRSNPLLQAGIVRERTRADATTDERIATLRALIAETVESLRSAPRDAKLYRAILRTYLRPAPTQEAAAELLDLPFSTYRRHLRAGITRVAELLWQREMECGGR